MNNEQNPTRGSSLRPRRCFRWVLAASMLLFEEVATVEPSIAHAQSPAADEEARLLFEAGRAAFSAGRYEEALERFRRAYELSGRAQLLYNIGVSADRLRRDEEALDAFRRYLELVAEDDNRAEIQARVAILEREVAERRRAQEQGAEPTHPDSSPEPSPPRTLVEEAPAPTPSRAGQGEPVAIAGAALASVGLVAAAVLGPLTLATDGSLASTCSPACAPSQREELRALAVGTDVALGVSLVGAVVLGVGLALGVDGESASVALIPEAGGASIAFRGRLP